MHWFTIAILVPILQVSGNYLDKYILSLRDGQRGGPGVVILFSAIFSTLTLVAIGLFSPQPFSIELTHIPILILNGFIAMAATAIYLYAIDEDEISVVIPMLQFIPVFGLILGFFLLGESISGKQLLGGALIIAGAVFLALEILDIKTLKLKLKYKVILLAITSSFLYAISGAIFKLFATSDGYWGVQFWEYAGVVIFGILFLFFSTKNRRNFIKIIKNKRRDFIGLNFAGETLMVAADLTSNFATLLAPIFLVYTITSLQPLIVVVTGIILTLIAPKLINEQWTKQRAIQKILSTSLIVLGSLIIII